MKALASILALFILSNCTPAETTRMLFLKKLQAAIQNGDEENYRKLIFDDPRAEGKTPQLYLKNNRLGDDQRSTYYAINRLQSELKNQSFVETRSKTDFESKSSESFTLNKNGAGEIRNVKYTPFTISFWNEKKQTFIELTIWEVSEAVSYPNEDTKGRGPKTYTNQLYLGDITLFEDVIDESN